AAARGAEDAARAEAGTAVARGASGGAGALAFDWAEAQAARVQALGARRAAAATPGGEPRPRVVARRAGGEPAARLGARAGGRARRPPRRAPRRSSWTSSRSGAERGSGDAHAGTADDRRAERAREGGRARPLDRVDRPSGRGGVDAGAGRGERARGRGRRRP